MKHRQEFDLLQCLNRSCWEYMAGANGTGVKGVHCSSQTSELIRSRQSSWKAGFIAGCRGYPRYLSPSLCTFQPAQLYTMLSCFLRRFDLGGFHVFRNNQKSFKHCLVDEVVDQTENCTFGQKRNDIKKKKMRLIGEDSPTTWGQIQGEFWNCPEQDNVNRSVFSQDEYRERQQSFKQINWCICLKSHLLSSTWRLTCCIDNLTYYTGESHA